MMVGKVKSYNSPRVHAHMYVMCVHGGKAGTNSHSRPNSRQSFYISFHFVFFFFHNLGEGIETLSRWCEKQHV